MNDGIHFGEFPDYIEEENRRWKQFFGRHPEALDLPLDIAGTCVRCCGISLRGNVMVTPGFSRCGTFLDLFPESSDAIANRRP